MSVASRKAVESLTWRRFGSFTRQIAVGAAATHRRYSSEPRGPDKSQKRANFRPVASSTHDWIGPPNPLSNLRPIVHRIPERETGLERRLRALRQETEDWNHEFWTQQNLTFGKEKEVFISSQLKAKGLSARDEQGRQRSLNSEEMAVFYKAFLDKNRVRHSNYNKEWYRRNFTITFLMARVNLQNIWRSAINKFNNRRGSTPTS